MVNDFEVKVNGFAKVLLLISSKARIGYLSVDEKKINRTKQSIPFWSHPSHQIVVYQCINT